jgi:hypothetical protein
MEQTSSTGATRKAMMGVPGNLYITTACVAFLPLDGSLKSSSAVMMFDNLHHHKKGNFMQLVDSSGDLRSVATDAVKIAARDGNSILLTDFLSMYVIPPSSSLFVPATSLFIVQSSICRSICKFANNSFAGRK